MMPGWPFYPLFVSLAVAVGGVCCSRLLRGLGVSLGRQIGFLLVGAVVALLGAKLFSAVERGGLVWWDPAWELTHGYRYPGAILALVLVARPVRRFLLPNLDLLKIGDVLAPTIALSMVWVRIGCFFGGCCHGTPTTLPWGVVFPPESAPWRAHVDRGWIAIESATSLAVHPLQLYFALASLALTAGLFAFRHRRPTAGACLFVFLAVDGALKLGLEQLRLDHQAALADFAAAELLAGIIAPALRRFRR